MEQEGACRGAGAAPLSLRPAPPHLHFTENQSLCKTDTGPPVFKYGTGVSRYSIDPFTQALVKWVTSDGASWLAPAAAAVPSAASPRS
jgi:hypothetical protein